MRPTLRSENSCPRHAARTHTQVPQLRGPDVSPPSRVGLTPLSAALTGRAVLKPRRHLAARSQRRKEAVPEPRRGGHGRMGLAFASATGRGRLKGERRLRGRLAECRGSLSGPHFQGAV